MDIEFKNGSYIYTIPCGDTKRPIRMVFESVPILTEDVTISTEVKYAECIMNLLNNIAVINGAYTLDGSYSQGGKSRIDGHETII